MNDTDVLLWWGHVAHNEVPDDLVNRITGRVYNDGMGFIALHSGHHSKPFRQIVGTTGNLLWSDNQHEIVWNVNAAHPIAAGVGEYIDLELEEMYGEPFAIPQPDELVFMSWFEHGYVSAAAAAGPKVAVVCFISNPVMKNAVPITILRFRELFTTLLNGQNPTNSAHLFITAIIAATFADFRYNVQHTKGAAYMMRHPSFFFHLMSGMTFPTLKKICYGLPYHNIYA